MTAIVVWFAIVCYTSTIASCIKYDGLPDAAECNVILAKVKTKRAGARLEQCDSRRVMAQGAAPGNYLLAQ